MTKNRTRTPVYLDPGMHPGLEDKGLINQNAVNLKKTNEQLLFLDEQFHNFTQLTNQRIEESRRAINFMSIRHNTEVVISHIEHICRDFLADHDFWLHRKESLELGRLTEALLPPPLPPEVFAGISSVEQSDSTVIFQPDVNVNIIATQGITVTYRCHGKPSLVVTIPPGVFSVTLIYPCTLSADNWTIESQFRFIYNTSLTDDFKFTLPVNSYLEPLIAVNITDHFTRLNLPQQQIQLSDFVQVDLPSSINHSYYWRLSFVGLGAIPLLAVVGLWFRWRKRGLCASRAHRPRTDKPSTMNMDMPPPESVATALTAADPVPRFRIYPVLQPGSANTVPEIKSESV